MIKKVAKILRSFFISTIGEESWNVRNRIERFFYIIEFPAILLLFSLLFYSLRSFEYNQVLIITLWVWLFSRIISYGSIYTSFLKEKGWSLVFSNIFFDLLFIVVVFDVAFNFGFFEIIKKYVIEETQNDGIDPSRLGVILVIGLFYTILFIALTKVRHALPKLLPSMKRFWGYNNLGKILVDFILLSLYIILFFAFIYYVIFIALQFNGFSSEKINFLEFVFYSFDILYSSPISSVEPTAIITKIVTAVESLFSYLILVIFISLLLSNYSEKLIRKNRKRKMTKRHVKHRRRF